METSNVADMTKRDHMRAFFRRATALLAFVALLWAVHLVHWIIGYGFNPAFGLNPNRLGDVTFSSNMNITAGVHAAAFAFA